VHPRRGDRSEAGELCALRWSDIDPGHGRVVIERGIIVVGGGLEERPTKTHNRRVTRAAPKE